MANNHPESARQRLDKKLESRLFSSLENGVILYKPPFSRKKYVVPNLQVKDAILRAMRLRWGVAGLGSGAELTMLSSVHGLYHQIPFTLLLVALAVLILKGAPKKIVRTLGRYSADGRN